MILPLVIDTGFWLLYYSALLNFARTFYNQPMVIHARVNLPVYDTPAIRFVVYSLFMYNTPYSVYNIMNGQSFRILFNYDHGREDIELNQLEILPSGGGPPLYSDDNTILQMMNRILDFFLQIK